MQEWQRKLHDFSEKAAAKGKEAGNAAENDLNKAWTKADAASRKLQTVGAEGWESAKTSFEKASHELADAWHKIHPRTSKRRPLSLPGGLSTVDEQQRAAEHNVDHGHDCSAAFILRRTGAGFLADAFAFGCTGSSASEHGSLRIFWCRKPRSEASKRLKRTGGRESIHRHYQGMAKRISGAPLCKSAE